MFQLREAVGIAAVIVGAAALAAVNHHPTTGRRTERERAAIQTAGERLTHGQIAAAWTETKLGNTRPLQDLQRTFPLAPRAVHEERSAVVLTFAGHNETCIDFVSQPHSSMVRTRHC